MKKLYIVLLFIISVLVAFFVTRSISEDKSPVSESIVLEPESPEVVVNPVDTPCSPEISQPQTINPPNRNQKNKTEGMVTNPQKNPALPIVKPREPGNVDKPDTIKVKPKKHVTITPAEVKKLIMTGRYTKDKRIAKNYSIEYVDVSDDDINAGLQQNLQYVQDRVEYGEDGGGWRGFEVVDLDYNSETGLVNRIIIRPIY